MEATRLLGSRHPETIWSQDPGRLMEAFLGKDPSAAEELYRRFAGRIFGIGMVILRNRTQAEDLVQDTFVNLWRTGMAFDSKRGSLDSWVVLTACRLALDIHHRRSTETRIPTSELAYRKTLREMAEDESLARTPHLNVRPMTFIQRRRVE
jgi:RNA polymerase sigma factor (sigma-70 family)